MSDWPELRTRRDGVTIPKIWVAVALSLILHLAVMWKCLPELHLPSPEESKLGASRRSLEVQLAPPPRPPSIQIPPAPAPQTQPVPPRPVPRPPPAAPVLALKTPPPTPAPTVPVPPPPRPPGERDFASDIEARRRARGELLAAAPPAPPAPASITPQPPVEDDKARSARIAVANLATQNKQTFGYDPSQGGGVFQIMRMGYTDAEFLFFGWNKDIRRNTKQVIEVRKGNNPDTRIAVVRRMIAIIREHEQEDFLWESPRLGRSMMLSARARDNAGLEAFLLQEFFDDPRRPW